MVLLQYYACRYIACQIVFSYVIELVNIKNGVLHRVRIVNKNEIYTLAFNNEECT